VEDDSGENRKQDPRPSVRSGEVHVFRSGTGTLELTHPLTGAQIVVGRNADAQICLDHETVSRNHAELLCGPFGQWWIHDLGSTNGTYVNGSQVHDRMLNPGDEIRIGRYVLYLKLPEPRRFEGLPSSSHRTPARRPTPRPMPGSPTTPPPPPPIAIEEIPPSRPRADDLTTIMQLPQGAPREISADHLTKTMALRRRLMGIEDPLKRLLAVCDFIVGDDFPTHNAMVLRLRDPANPTLLCGPRRRDGSPSVAALSHTVLQTLWDTREPVVASNLGESETRLGTVKEQRKLTLPRMVRPLAVVACPLWEDEDRVDALYVELPAHYGTDEWRTLLALIADAYRQAELVWEMKEHVRITAYVERELTMARHIQDGLVPSSAQFDDLDVAIGYEPSRWVGGDYVDAAPLGDGRVLLAIADVCGKGLQAALVSSSLHTLVRATLDTLEDLPQLAVRMNRYLCNYLPSDSFVTMIYLTLDPRTGAIECLNAGHPPPLVIRRDGAIRTLQSEVNVAFGIVETSFEVERSSLHDDEVLFLYTDGLFELVDPSGQALGIEGLATNVGQIVRSRPHGSSDDLKRALDAMLDDYRGAQLATDDSTFLLARRNP
jgi:phosphoserine phosphatase RsbU/P